MLNKGKIVTIWAILLTLGGLACANVAFYGGNIDLTGSCALRLRMDDNAATTAVTDSSGSGVDGTWQHGNTDSDTVASGKIGRCLSFDGANDYMDFAVSPTLSTSAGAIVMWANTSTILVGTDWAFYHSAVDNLLYLYRSADAYKIRLSDGGSVDTTYDFVVGTWHHIAVTWNGTAYATYFDGAAGASGSITAFTNLNAGQYIGCASAGASTWHGKLDAVMIFTSALTADEIKFLYNTGNGQEELTNLRRPMRGKVGNYGLRSMK